MTHRGDGLPIVKELDGAWGSNIGGPWIVYDKAYLIIEKDGTEVLFMLSKPTPRALSREKGV